MTESNEILTMRAMAWDRAKGELLSVLQTYWPSYAPDGTKIDNGFDTANDLIKAFIQHFEDNCR
jgi:hypothetical protein